VVVVEGSDWAAVVRGAMFVSWVTSLSESISILPTKGEGGTCVSW